jgi:hypothetical protein
VTIFVRVVFWGWLYLVPFDLFKLSLAAHPVPWFTEVHLAVLYAACVLASTGIAITPDKQKHMAQEPNA